MTLERQHPPSFFLIMVNLSIRSGSVKRARYAHNESETKRTDNVQNLALFPTGLGVSGLYTQGPNMIELRQSGGIIEQPVALDTPEESEFELQNDYEVQAEYLCPYEGIPQTDDLSPDPFSYLDKCYANTVSLVSYTISVILEISGGEEESSSLPTGSEYDYAMLSSFRIPMCSEKSESIKQKAKKERDEESKKKKVKHRMKQANKKHAKQGAKDRVDKSHYEFMPNPAEGKSISVEEEKSITYSDSLTDITCVDDDGLFALLPGQIICYDSIALANNRGTRDFDYYTVDGYDNQAVFINGLFTFANEDGDQVYHINHILTPLGYNQIVLRCSTNGIICIAEIGNFDIPNIVGTRHYADLQTQKSKIRLITRNVLPTLLAKSPQFNMMYAAKLIKSKYKSNYKNYAELESDINEVLFEPFITQYIADYYERIDARQEEFILLKEQRYDVNNDGGAMLLKAKIYCKNILYPVLKFMVKETVIRGGFAIAKYFMGSLGIQYLVLEASLHVVSGLSTSFSLMSARSNARRDYNHALDPRIDTPVVSVCSLKTVKQVSYSNHVRELPPIDPNVMLRVDQESFEEDKSKTIDHYGPTIKGCHEVTPSGGTSDLYNAVVNRMAFDRFIDPNVGREFYLFSRSIIRNLFPRLNLEFGDYVTESKEFLISHYGLKRGEYLGGLLGEEFTIDDVWSVLFVKPETYLGKTTENYKARMIWKRSDRFLAKYAYFFHVLTHQLMEWINSHSNIKYSGCMNPLTVGNTVADFNNEYRYVAESDASSWDGSLNKWHHLIELELMDLVDTDLDISFLIENWTNVWGRARDRSLEYKAKRGRRSGDLWTSAFNSILNIFLVAFSHNRTNLFLDKSVALLVQGDDNVVFSDVLFDGDSIVECYRLLGMKLEYIPRSTIDDVEFCSGYFWPVGDDLIYGNKPFRQLAKMGRDYYKYGKKMHNRLLVGTAKSLLCSMGHIPIVGAILRAIADCEMDGIKAYKDKREWNPYRITGGIARYPELNTYNYFSEKYSIPLNEIFRLEEWIENTVSIEMFPCEFSGWFESCLEVDIGSLSDYENVMQTQEGEMWFDRGLPNTIYEDLVCAPYREELRKLMLVRDGLSIENAAHVISDVEVEHGSPEYVHLLHRLFLSLTCCNFYAGVAFHAGYNALALTINGVLCSKKSTKRKKKKKKKGGGKRPAWKTALGNLMRAGGGALGSFYGGPVGGMVGEALGSGLSKVTGMGAYDVHANTLASAELQFDNAGGFMICHREFISLIYGSVDLTTTVWDINPGLSTTFPWLAVLAENYERYDIKGLVFEFISTAGYLTSTQAQGVVVMATQYDPEADAFTTRREMEAYLYTTSGIVTESQVHFVECDPKDRPMEEMYIRYGTSTSESRFTDHGKMTLAVEGCPEDDELLGELWVTYQVELKNPRLQAHGYSTAKWAHYAGIGYDNTDILGPVLRSPSGTLEIVISATGSGYDTISFPNVLDNGIYLVLNTWYGDSTASMSCNVSLTGCFVMDGFNSNSEDYVHNNSSTGSRYFQCFIMQIDSQNASIKYSSATLPSNGSYVDVYIAQIGDPTPDEILYTYMEAVKNMRGVRIRHPKSNAIPETLSFETQSSVISYGDAEDDQKESFREFMLSRMG